MLLASLLRPQECAELNITKCMFLQSRAGQYEQKFIFLYFLADLRYTVHIYRYFVFRLNK